MFVAYIFLMVKYNEKPLFVKTEDPSAYQSSLYAPDTIGSNVSSIRHGDDVIRVSGLMFATTAERDSPNQVL